MGILQNLPALCQIPAGAHRIGDIHKAIQMDKARSEKGNGAQGNAGHRLAKP